MAEALIKDVIQVLFAGEGFAETIHSTNALGSTVPQVHLYVCNQPPSHQSTTEYTLKEIDVDKALYSLSRTEDGKEVVKIFTLRVCPVNPAQASPGQEVIRPQKRTAIVLREIETGKYWRVDTKGTMGYQFLEPDEIMNQPHKMHLLSSEDPHSRLKPAIDNLKKHKYVTRQEGKVVRKILDSIDLDKVSLGWPDEGRELVGQAKIYAIQPGWEGQSPHIALIELSPLAFNPYSGQPTDLNNWEKKDQTAQDKSSGTTELREFAGSELRGAPWYAVLPDSSLSLIGWHQLHYHEGTATIAVVRTITGTLKLLGDPHFQKFEVVDQLS